MPSHGEMMPSQPNVIGKLKDRCTKFWETISAGQPDHVRRCLEEHMRDLIFGKAA